MEDEKNPFDIKKNLEILGGKHVHMYVCGRPDRNTQWIRLATYDLGPLADHDMYRNVVSNYLATVGICDFWYKANNLAEMMVQTELGDVVAEFTRH